MQIYNISQDAIMTPLIDSRLPGQKKIEEYFSSRAHASLLQDISKFLNSGEYLYWWNCDFSNG